MTQEEFLLHYGVKGMKWGVRKQLERVKTARLERRNAKIGRKKDKKWEKDVSEKIMAKYGTDPALRNEVYSKATKILKKNKYASDEDANNLTTALFAEAMNKRLANDQDAKSPSGNKRVKIDVVSVDGQLLLATVVEDRNGKG